jgi:hypothetical protein
MQRMQEPAAVDDRLLEARRLGFPASVDSWAPEPAVLSGEDRTNLPETPDIKSTRLPR